jgi:prephenate dehydratase
MEGVGVGGVGGGGGGGGAGPKTPDASGSPGQQRRKMFVSVEGDLAGVGATAVTRSPSLLKARSTLGLDVAVVGGKQSLSHQALMSLMDGDDQLNVTYTDSFEGVFKLVDKGTVHSGVVPIENTSMGTFPGIYHLTLMYPAVKIIGEHIVEENHCLCALPGTKLEDVDEIAAHPWAGSQCAAWLQRFQTKQGAQGNHVRRILANDTAAACKMALERRNTAVVQQAQAARAVGLEVLADGISDDVNNKTRFILVSKEELVFPKFEKMSTTVAFALANTTGSIFKALACFGLRDIDIRRMITVRRLWRRRRRR